MTSVEQRSRTVLCWCRLADGLTRAVVPFRRFRASLERPEGVVEEPEYKEDGHFAFAAVEASTASATIVIEGHGYEQRTIARTLTGAPLELTYAGEDELYVLVNQVLTGPRRVTFDAIPYLPTVPAGATVLGPGGVSTTLSNALEGVTVGAATLTTVAGVTVDMPLRLIRSSRLLLRPGPSYPFPSDQTVVDLTVLDDATSEPIDGATATIDQVDGAAPTTQVVDGLTLHIALPLRLVLGSASDIAAQTDERGRAVFYYAPATPITSLRFSVAAAGYVTKTSTVAVTQQQRTPRTIRLVRA